MKFFTSRMHDKRRGIALLLVIVLTAAVLSVSIGIFNVMVGEFRISGDVADSFHALYAADQTLEWGFYRDRVQHAFCSGGPGVNCFTQTDISLPGGACYTIQVSKFSTAPATKIFASGQYRCGTTGRVVRRAFEARY